MCSFLAISCGNSRELKTIETHLQSRESSESIQHKSNSSETAVDLVKETNHEDQGIITSASKNTALEHTVQSTPTSKLQDSASDPGKDSKTTSPAGKPKQDKHTAEEYSKSDNRRILFGKSSTDEIIEDKPSGNNPVVSDNQNTYAPPTPNPAPTSLPIPTPTSTLTPDPVPDWPKAPGFSLPSARGNQVTLESYLGQNNTILVFYRAYF